MNILTFSNLIKANMSLESYVVSRAEHVYTIKLRKLKLLLKYARHVRHRKYSRMSIHFIKHPENVIQFCRDIFHGRYIGEEYWRALCTNTDWISCGSCKRPRRRRKWNTWRPTTRNCSRIYFRNTWPPISCLPLIQMWVPCFFFFKLKEFFKKL